MVAVVGRDQSGLWVRTCGPKPIAGAGLEAIEASHGLRNVDVRFTPEREALEPAIAA